MVTAFAELASKLSGALPPDDLLDDPSPDGSPLLAADKPGCNVRSPPANKPLASCPPPLDSDREGNPSGPIFSEPALRPDSASVGVLVDVSIVNDSVVPGAESF